MFIKPTKKWRNPVGNDKIMVPYTYYRLCESYRDSDGKTKQRTVLGLGELLDFQSADQKQELADLLTELINDGTCRICDNPALYDAAINFYGKWLDEKNEAQARADHLAEEVEKPRACDPLSQSAIDPRFLFLIDPYKVLVGGVNFILYYLPFFPAFILRTLSPDSSMRCAE